MCLPAILQAIVPCVIYMSREQKKASLDTPPQMVLDR